MRALIKVTASTALLGAAAFVLTGCGGGSGTSNKAATLQSTPDTSHLPTVNVSGHGKVEGTPDTATVTIGVETRGDKAQDALAQNNQEATDLIAALKQKGVAAKDIQTSNLSVTPTWDKDGRVNGYSVSNTVTARLHDIENAGAIVDAAAARVGNDIRLQGVTFSIDNTSALVAKARADAVKDAVAQAHQLADAAGVKLGAIRTIDDTNKTLPQSYAFDAQASSGALRTTPIEAGSQELSVDVTITFDIAS